MDFTNELAAFQGAIISADNVHQFSNITSKGGNGEKVKFVIESVKRFLKMEKYIDENGQIDTMVSNTRKFAIYLVLNADLPVLGDMMDITGIEPLIWSIPTVPRYLMCEIMWQLHMDTFVYEIILNCWPQLGLEVAEAFLENFKYFSPTECLNKLYKLSAACYALICRLTCFKFQGEVLTNLLASLFNTLEKYFKYFINPPNKYKLDVLSNDDLYKYKGKQLESVLYLVNDCFNSFSTNSDPNCYEPFYKLTYNEDYLQNTTCKACESPNKLIVECLHNSNVLLLDICKGVVMDISVEIFCAWSEFEENGKSVQQRIGELCNKTHILLQSISSVSEHPVVSMIKLMARKPTDLKDVINSVDNATILQKINIKNEESQSWIHALVNKEHLDQDVDLIKVLIANTSIFDDQECFKLYNVLEDTSSGINEEANNHLHELKLNLFKKCTATNKHIILKSHFRDKTFADCCTPGDQFDTMLNEMFNKFVADTDVDLTDILTVFYLNPKRVYSKIFEVAAQSSRLIETMLQVMLLLNDYKDYYYDSDTEPCMIQIMRYRMNNCEQEYYSNIVKFIHELKNLNVIFSSQLLMLVIMPSIHAALVNKNVGQMHIQVLLLKEAYSMDELVTYRPPMLVMMAQIMQTVRVWQTSQFHIDSIRALEITIEFQKSIMNSYGGIIPDTDGSWLRHKMQEMDLHPLNVYYFKSLWNVDSRSFMEVASKEPIHKDGNLKTYAFKLTLVIPFAIFEEWCEIWDNFIQAGLCKKDVSRLFHSSIRMLSKAIIRFDIRDNTVPLLFYCFTNLIHIIRYKYFHEPLTDYQVMTSVCFLAETLAVTTEYVSQVEAIIAPLFSYLAERRDDFTFNIIGCFIDSDYFNVVNRYFPIEEMYY